MIDILLPFYGDPVLLKESVLSVLRQSRPVWNLTIVDDAYPDEGIQEWLRGLASRHPKVQYHRNNHNLGANLNYTKALSLSRAEFVVILGADDVMLPNYVEQMMGLRQQFPEAAVLECGVAVIDESGKRVRPLVDRVKAALRPRTTDTALLGGDALITSLLRGNWTYFPSLCWRRSLISRLGFRENFHVVQDLALLVDVLRSGERMGYSPRLAFEYRRHKGSDSAVKTLAGARFAEERAYFDLASRELAQDGYPRAARAARVHMTSRLHAASLIPTALRTRDNAAVARLAAHALK